MKHKISCCSIFVWALGFIGCEQIERVREQNGICSQEFTEAYNLLGDSIAKLPEIDESTKYEEQLGAINTQCAEFFKTYDESVECDAFQGDNRVTVKGADYILLCEDPRRVESGYGVPGKIVREGGGGQ